MRDAANPSPCPFDGREIAGAVFAGTADFAAIYNIAPILPGHSLVIPRCHIERVQHLTDEDLCAMFSFARRVTTLLTTQFKADGFDWTVQDGLSAGQTINHIHLHIIPRWRGDLPSPGDWYKRLNLPVASSGKNESIDSEARRKLGKHEMARVVAPLRKAAKRLDLTRTC